MGDPIEDVLLVAMPWLETSPIGAIGTCGDLTRGQHQLDAFESLALEAIRVGISHLITDSSHDEPQTDFVGVDLGNQLLRHFESRAHGESLGGSQEKLQPGREPVLRE